MRDRMRPYGLKNSAFLDQAASEMTENCLLDLFLFSGRHSLSEPVARLVRARRAAFTNFSDFGAEIQVPSCKFPINLSVGWKCLQKACVAAAELRERS